jgi:hypothetical protein
MIITTAARKHTETENIKVVYYKVWRKKVKKNCIRRNSIVLCFCGN